MSFIELLKEYNNKWADAHKPGRYINTDFEQSGCEHEWKPYVGFTQKYYYYCTKCDEKDHNREVQA